MKKYFITGVSEGLGLELMKKLVARGDFVYGVSRKKIPEDPMLKTSKDRWVWRSCDVTQDIEIMQTIEHQQSLKFLPDIVILNAGVYGLDREEFRWIDYQELFKVNCEGALKWVEHYLPLFNERRRGHFVYISSLSVKFLSLSSNALRVESMYAASKAYPSMVFQCLKERYSSTEIRFTRVFPGLMKTAMSSNVRVPGILFCSVSKAAKKILRFIDSGGGDLSFPRWRLLVQPLVALFPRKVLARLKGKD